GTSRSATPRRSRNRGRWPRARSRSASARRRWTAPARIRRWRRWPGGAPDGAPGASAAGRRGPADDAPPPRPAARPGRRRRWADPTGGVRLSSSTRAPLASHGVRVYGRALPPEPPAGFAFRDFRLRDPTPMKKDIHPDYHFITVVMT